MAAECIGALVDADAGWRVSGDELIIRPSVDGVLSDLLPHLREAKSALLTIAKLTDNCLFVDFETRAPVNLSKVGTWRYVADPNFEVLCAAMILPSGEEIIQTANLHTAPAQVIEAVAAGAAVVAHNAFGFDRLVWRELGWPEPSSWVDTLLLARRAGLVGQLDALGRELLGVGKDDAGKRLALAVGRLDTATGRLPVVHAQQLSHLGRYCVRDARLLRGIWCAELARHRGFEEALIEVDATINARGFLLDELLATRTMCLERELAVRAQRQAPVAMNVLTSPSKIRRWLAAAGLCVADARRATLENLIDDPDLPQDVRAVIVARLLSAGITGRKLESGLSMRCPDGRVRGTLAFYAARTGRWAGRGLQPQNLPRGCLKPEQLERAIDVALAGKLDDVCALAEAFHKPIEEVLSTLVRPCIVAPQGRLLAIVDYAQIEARAVLWLARDEGNLSVFRSGRDPYVEVAARLLGLAQSEVTPMLRALGKVLVLGCGYGVGPERFSAYGAAFGIDWSRVPITSEAAIDSWRDTHSSVAGRRTGDFFQGRPVRRGGLWKDVEAAAVSAVERGGIRQAARCTWELRGVDLVCTLPSGRDMIYRHPRLERPLNSTRLRLSYSHRGQRVTAWGGKFVENVSQAVCRDLLADALVKLERARLDPIMHVHDEVLCEVDEASALSEVIACCESAPPWAEGMPISVSGFVSPRYRK